MIIRKLPIVKYKVLHSISGRTETFSYGLLGSEGVTIKFGIIRRNDFPIKAVCRFCATATPKFPVVHQ
jgi:hypothetical protein